MVSLAEAKPVVTRDRVFPVVGAAAVEAPPESPAGLA